jgi:hypothetical protein
MSQEVIKLTCFNSMQNIDREVQKLIGTIFPILGAGLLLGAVVSAPFTYHFTQIAARAEGEVIRLDAGGAHPVIRFVPVGADVIEFSGHGWINYAVGDKVTMLYLKDIENPTGFQMNIDTPGALWFDQFVSIWLGTIFMIGGLYMKSINKH